MRCRKCGISSGSTLFATHSAILDTTLGSKFYLFKFFDKYGKELRCLTTKGKYGKVTDTKIKWSIISKSLTIIIFVEFIYRLIDYPINCASLNTQHGKRAIMWWSSWAWVSEQSDLGILCLLTYTIGAIDSVRRQWKPRSVCAYAQADQGLHCPQIT